MNKVVLLIIKILMVIVFIFLGGIYVYSNKVDTKYATEYAQVFGSYNIEKVDRYLNENTLITYKNITKPYKDLRKNVISAFDSKLFEMANGASYGHGNNCFFNGVQSVGVQTYVISERYNSEFVSMELERHGLVFYKVKSLTSSDDFFGYLFFGITK